MQPQHINNILIFKTGVLAHTDVLNITPAFNAEPHIEEWSVDLDDCDKVLRVVTSLLDAPYIIQLLNEHGYLCIELE